MNKPAALLLALSLLPAFACDPARDSAPGATQPTPPSPPPPAEPFRADCQQMCERTFLRCAAEVLTSSGKMTGLFIGRLKATGAWKKLQKKSHAACLRNCLRKKGLGKDAPAIRRCLTRKGCDHYARCVKPFVK